MQIIALGILALITILVFLGLQYTYQAKISSKGLGLFSFRNLIMILISCGVVVGISVGLYKYAALYQGSQPTYDYTEAEQQYKIAKDFYTGKNLPKDNYQAVNWLILAADQEHEQAKEMLSLLGYFAQSQSDDTENVESQPHFTYIPANKIKTKLKDVAGQNTAKKELNDLLTFIKEPAKYQNIGARAPKGILLYGPPGTGKTLLARAIAGESGVNFLATSGGAFEDSYVGVGAARIRELFRFARKNKPSIIFIDEIDALAPSRKKELSQSQVQVINQLLAEMSGIDEAANEGIFLLAATNRLESLDNALLRPGRFDRQVYVKLPSLEDRKEIVQYLLTKVKHQDNIDLEQVALKTAGFSGAELDAVINEAAIMAVKNNKSEISTDELEQAIKKLSAFERDPNPSLKMNILTPYEIKTRFDDVAGMNEAKKEVMDVINYLKNPEHYQEMGATIPKGIMIHGPPGTGKTMMARAMAGEAQVSFLAVSGSDFDEQYVGVGASRIRELFKTARKFSPCIVFIDELDALAPKRQELGSTGRDQTINQLLSEMDNIQEDINKGIIFVGATNRLDLIDDAVLRPGRFDRKVYFRLPSTRERKEIIAKHLEKVKYDPNLNIGQIARTTPNFSGADLANLINEAAIYAASNNKQFIDSESVEYAKDKIVLGVDLGTRDFSEKEIKMTAYHEAGHVLVGLLHPDYPKKLHKATVGMRGHALGVTYFEIDEGSYSTTKKQLEAMIAVSMGGMVAEELIFGKENLTTGISNDLEHANLIAKNMVKKYAMDDDHSFLMPDIFGKGLSDDAKNAEKILERNYSVAKDIIEKNKDKLIKIAEGLIEKEILSYDEIVELIGLNKPKEEKNLNLGQ